MDHSRLIDICTNTGYMSNMYRLHKHDTPERFPSSFAALLVLALSGDIAVNPGPPKKPMFPCGTCQLAVSWRHSGAVQCDVCDVWHHQTCASIDSSLYARITDISWKCHCCRSRNIESFSYHEHSYNIDVSNSYSPLAGLNAGSSDVASPADDFMPGNHSSPVQLSPRARPPVLAITSDSEKSSSKESNFTFSTSTVDNFRVLVANCNGVKGKRAEIAELFNSYQPDVAIIAETKLPKPSSKVKPSEFFPKNYAVDIHKPRDENGGGVLIAIKKGIVADEVTLKASSTGEIVCARIKLAKSDPLYVLAFYRPPDDTVDSLKCLESVLEELSKLSQKHPKSTIILGGDFNARDIDWDRLKPSDECQKKGMCQNLINILGDAHLHQMQREDTREDAILELFCTNKSSLVNSIHTIPGISDHDGIILADMSIKAVVNKKPPRKAPIWSKAKWSEMKDETVDFVSEFLADKSTGFDNRSVQENWDMFCDHLKHVQREENLPTRTTSARYHLPWLTAEIKKMCARKRRLYNKAKKSGKPADKAAFKALQNKTRDALRVAHWNYVNGMLKEGLEQGSNKPFYQYVKSQKQDNQGVSALRDKTTGQLHSDPAEKSRLLSEQFKSVFTRSDPAAPVKTLPSINAPTIPKLSFNTTGVELLLHQLNPRKASGPDEIPARLLQTMSKELAPALTAIYNQSLEAGTLPTQWKTAWIAPVFKKGSHTEPVNYRPVSLTCVPCKLMEHCICTHIRTHLDNHNLLGEENHGFRKRHSTETQLLITTHDMLKARDMGHQMDALILDLSKAFDTVPHRELLGKLERYGVEGDLLAWTGDFLQGRTQSVLVDGVRSREEPVLSGVPQGTVYGPLLFLVYINDMAELVSPGTKIRLFADDTILYRITNTLEDQLILQQDLKKLEQWAKDWGMRFNAGKCHVLTVNKGPHRNPFFYELDNTVLSSVEHEKYLGCTIHQDMDWSSHVNLTATKASQTLGFIKRNLKGCPEELRRLAYVSLVRSSMEYASVIWDPYEGVDAGRLEKIQRKAVRWIKNDYNWKHSVTDMMTELKLEPLDLRRRVNRLTFLYKIVNSKVAVQPERIDLYYKSRPHRGITTQKQFKHLKPKTPQFENSFSPRTLRDWNNLLDSTTSSASVTSFRSQVVADLAP